MLHPLSSAAVRYSWHWSTGDTVVVVVMLTLLVGFIVLGVLIR